MIFLPPDKHTTKIMVGSFAAALIWLLCGDFVNLIHTVSMFAHESGHAISGWLLGTPSFPIPYLTAHFNYSWKVQVAVLLVLGFLCYWLHPRNRELFLICLTVTILVGLIGFSKYNPSVISYMGHGGGIIIGGVFVYLGWTFKNFKNTLNHAVVAFAGFAILFDNIAFCFLLGFEGITRAEYSLPGSSSFGIDNDFVTLSNTFSFMTVQSLGIFTMLFGIIILVASNLLAMFSTKAHDSNQYTELDL